MSHQSFDSFIPPEHAWKEVVALGIGEPSTSLTLQDGLMAEFRDEQEMAEFRGEQGLVEF